MTNSNESHEEFPKVVFRNFEIKELSLFNIENIIFNLPSKNFKTLYKTSNGEWCEEYLVSNIILN